MRRFVVTSMQENSLHGWRLVPDKGNMRMSGYPSKTRSVSWSGDGKWLATSGAEAAILWPFDSKEGPMGKPPRECGVRPAKVSRVAFHPNTSRAGGRLRGRLHPADPPDGRRPNCWCGRP